jgi:LPXTG-motif cell wall-anchored protein
VPQFTPCPLNTTITKTNFPIGCVCPDGTRFDSGSKRCENIPPSGGGGGGGTAPGPTTKKAGLGVSPFLALAIVGAAVVGGAALYGARKKKRRA